MNLHGDLLIECFSQLMYFVLLFESFQLFTSRMQQIFGISIATVGLFVFSQRSRS